VTKTLHKNDVKDKNIKIDNENKSPKKKIIKIGPVAKCNKCQEYRVYRHITIDCTSHVKIIMPNGVLIVASESGSIVPPKVTPVIKGWSEDFPNKLPPICVTPYTIEPGSDKFTFQLGEVDSDTDKKVIRDNIGLNCIRPTPSIHLSVVRYVSS